MKMKRKIFFALFVLFFLSCKKEPGKTTVPLYGDNGDTEERAFVLADQKGDRLRIISHMDGKEIWSWSPEEAAIPEDRKAWFGLIDEVKPVYDCKYLLFSCTRGAIGLVRIADKKLMFYARPQGWPHSVELLPDGRVVSASSSDGTSHADKLRIYDVDTTAVFSENPLNEYPLTFGHNAVWDREKELLWATGDNVLYAYTYQQSAASLQLVKRIPLPDEDYNAHDLFPDYGTKKLWLTTISRIMSFDTEKDAFEYKTAQYVSNIKSVSSGPSGYPTIILHPTESYWSDTVLDVGGRRVFKEEGARIYKVRWLIDNPFSYTPGNDIKQ